MAVRKFRIERQMGLEDPSEGQITKVPNPAHDMSHSPAGETHEILAAIAEIKKAIDGNSDLDLMRADMAKAASMDGELQAMQDAISSTKAEIAALHTGGFQDDQIGRVSNELDAVVEGTEMATERILSASEAIDELAGNLNAGLQNEQKAMAADIQEKIIEIFEACNFQDLTGQRITKVVQTLAFVEDRVERMMGIWGGLDSFKDVVPVDLPERDEDAQLLNGPALESDGGIANQDDIDALFA